MSTSLDDSRFSFIPSDAQSIPTQQVGDDGLGHSTRAASNSFVAEAYNQAQQFTARLTVYREKSLVPPSEEVAAGSGVVVSPSGELVTDLHVVENANQIHVHLNGRNYNGHVVERDNQADLAVVQIDRTSPQQTFAYAELASSSRLKAKDALEAYGFPNGLPHQNQDLYFSPASYDGQMPLLGLGSVKGGLMTGEDPFRPILQVGGRAVPGNSGGPLFKASAGELQLVGVVDMSDSNDTIDATPVEDVRKMLEQTPGNSYYRRPDTMIAGNQPFFSARGSAGPAHSLPFAGLGNIEVPAPNAILPSAPASTDQNSINAIDKELQRLRQLFDEI